MSLTSIGRQGSFALAHSELAMPTSSRLLRLRDVQRATGLSRSSLYRLASEGRFPSAVKLTPHATAWHESEILAWIESRPRAASAKVAA